MGGLCLGGEGPPLLELSSMLWRVGSPVIYRDAKCPR